MPPMHLPPGSMPSPPEAKTGGVPAVERALAIVTYLGENGNAPATATQISRALEINPSTCFNILKTLKAGRFVGFDARSKTYELGLALGELAGAVDVGGQVQRLAKRHVIDLSRRLGLTSFLFKWTDDEDFVVVDKVDSRNRLRLTASVGERFPPGQAICSKTFFAWWPTDDLDAAISRYELLPASRSTTDIKRYRRELQTVRRRGFAVSIGEAHRDNNAVGAPILDNRGDVAYLVVVAGFSSELTPAVIKTITPQVVETATAISQAIAGS